MSLPTLFAPIADDMHLLDAEIRQRLDTGVPLIRTIGEYIIGGGGKRMRPALLLLVAKALGYQGNFHTVLAAVVEFIHTSTLLHDDVVDESELRRGRSTANAMFGNAASVLVGDFLYSRAFQMMVESDSVEVMKILANATNIIAEGEVLQLLNVHDADVTEDRYFQVVRYKTGKLFEASAELGAVLAHASPALQQAAAEYGMRVGAAFQLIDDVLDYSGDAEHLGKNVGDDLREGKPTLPLIRVMAVGTPEQQALIKSAIATGEADFEQVAQAIKQTDALQYTKQCAQAELQRAAHAIQAFPESSFKDSLIGFLDMAVNRDH